MRFSRFRPVALLLGLLMSMGCIGISASDLMATLEPTVAAEVWLTADVEIETAVAATISAQGKPATISSSRIALRSFHGRYVTALGEENGWMLGQELDLSECAWFTQLCLDNGRVALVTCYDRYVTAPMTGSTRWDWLLSQAPDLGDCGQFVVHDLESGGVVLETCAGRFVTAGDGYWDAGLEWSLVGETGLVDTWEQFVVVEQP